MPRLFMRNDHITVILAAGFLIFLLRRTKSPQFLGINLVWKKRNRQLLPVPVGATLRRAFQNSEIPPKQELKQFEMPLTEAFKRARAKLDESSSSRLN